MSSQPNVIVILSDDQGYGDLSCHGNPEVRTPNFDRLHDESVRFTDFHVAPMCTPTRGQLLTGWDALRNGATSVCQGRTLLRREVPTAADIFAANGYRTGLFGKWHLGDGYPYRPENRGFQETLYFPSAAITTAPDHWNNDYFDDTYRHNGAAQAYQGYCTDVFFTESMNWMQECQRQGRPFFTYLATGADHMPYYVPDRYREPYRHLDVYVASFFGMVADYDENMGRLEEFLRRSGLRENTILVFMTDNGAVVSADVYNAGMRGGKGSFYDGGHRVPCFVRWPGGRLRRRGAVEQPAQCQDVLPTLIDLCGLDTAKDQRFDGLSLAGVLRDEHARLPDRMLVVQHGEPMRDGAHAVLWEKWRLVGGKELYDLSRDPSQSLDLADRHPDIMHKMRDHYARWWTSLGPDVTKLESIAVGNPLENPARLCEVDWRGPMHWYQTQIRSLRDPTDAPAICNGWWQVNVETSGEYEIALRRWPLEVDVPLCAGLSAFVPTDKTFLDLRCPEYPHRKYAWTSAFPRAGEAMPVARARCVVGAQDLAVPVGSGDRAAVFAVRLSAGVVRLQTWFYDPEGRDLGGAFYVYVTRRGE